MRAWRLRAVVVGSVVVLVAVFAGLALAHAHYTGYRITTPNMSPAFKVGQHITVDDQILRSRPPRLNEVVALHPPAGADSTRCGAADEGAGTHKPCGVPTASASRQLFLERIVALPGDSVAVVHGRVIRNGKPEAQPYQTGPCRAADICDFPRAITVPPNEYFAMGDNRGDSADSRFWGPVKRAWIVGLVVK